MVYSFQKAPDIEQLWEYTLILIFFPPRSGFVQQGAARDLRAARFFEIWPCCRTLR